MSIPDILEIDLPTIIVMIVLWLARKKEGMAMTPISSVTTRQSTYDAPLIPRLQQDVN